MKRTISYTPQTRLQALASAASQMFYAVKSAGLKSTKTIFNGLFSQSKTTDDIEFGSVLDGIIMRFENNFYTFYRINGKGDYGTVLIQRAECFKMPENIGKVVWDNFKRVKVSDIDINGIIIERY